MTKAFLIDLARCIGCRACQAACKQWHTLPGEKTTNRGSYENPPQLSSATWTRVTFNEVSKQGQLAWVFAKIQCMHCEQPACVSACSEEALYQTPDGLVLNDIQKCIGCRNCHDACPFGVPGFVWENPIRLSNLMEKCTFCADRQAAGIEPACSKACPTDAIIFGERDDLLQEARSRVDASPDIYTNHIYGEHEVGGTSVLYLSPVPFEEIGFPTLGSEPIVYQLEADTAWSIGPFSWGLAAVVTGFGWIVNRRNKFTAAAQVDTEESE